MECAFRGASPDRQLQEQVQEVLGGNGGNEDVDDRAADDLLIHVRLFREVVPLRMRDVLDGDGLVNVRSLRSLAQGLLGANSRLDEIVTFVCDLLLSTENPGGFSYEEFDSAFSERVQEVYSELAG